MLFRGFDGDRRTNFISTIPDDGVCDIRASIHRPQENNVDCSDSMILIMMMISEV